MSTKCNKCEDKAWCWSCDECQSKLYVSYVMKLYHIEIVTLI